MTVDFDTLEASLVLYAKAKPSDANAVKQRVLDHASALLAAA